jgi:flagellar biogenesis protein FliO
LVDALDTVSLISPMLGVVAVIILAYFVTRWLATRSSFKPASGKHIRVIERVPMARDASLAMVRARGRTYLLSVGPGRVEKICELTDGAGELDDRPTDGFDSLLSQRMNGSRWAVQEPRRFRGEPSDERPRRFRGEPLDERPRRFRDEALDERGRRYMDQDWEERPRRGVRR